MDPISFINSWAENPTGTWFIGFVAAGGSWVMEPVMQQTRLLGDGTIPTIRKNGVELFTLVIWEMGQARGTVSLDPQALVVWKTLIRLLKELLWITHGNRQSYSNPMPGMGESSSGLVWITHRGD